MIPGPSIEDLFTYHSPTADQPKRYEDLRHAARHLAYAIDNLCPDGPDKTAAIRKLREAVMTANASIALEGCVGKTLTGGDVQTQVGGKDR